MQSTKKRPNADRLPPDDEEKELARISWSRERSRGQVAESGGCCPYAQRVFSMKDLVISCILPLVDQFEDVLALSRLCLATRSIMALHSREFAAFRLMLAPFGRSYSMAEWRNRAIRVIGNHGALRLYYYADQMQRLKHMRPISQGMESVMSYALSPRQGTLMGREEAFRFCERLVRDFVNWTVNSAGIESESVKMVRAALVFCRGPEDAIELHKRVFFDPNFVEPLYLIRPAVAANVTPDVFLYFADRYRASLSKYAMAAEDRTWTEENYLCEEVLYGKSAALVECVLARFKSERAFRHGIFKPRSGKNCAISTEILELLLARDIISFSSIKSVVKAAKLERFLTLLQLQADDDAQKIAIEAERSWWCEKLIIAAQK